MYSQKNQFVHALIKNWQSTHATMLFQDIQVKERQKEFSRSRREDKEDPPEVDGENPPCDDDMQAEITGVDVAGRYDLSEKTVEQYREERRERMMLDDSIAHNLPEGSKANARPPGYWHNVFKIKEQGFSWKTYFWTEEAMPGIYPDLAKEIYDTEIFDKYLEKQQKKPSWKYFQQRAPTHTPPSGDDELEKEDAEDQQWGEWGKFEFGKGRGKGKGKKGKGKKGWNKAVKGANTTWGNNIEKGEHEENEKGGKKDKGRGKGRGHWLDDRWERENRYQGQNWNWKGGYNKGGYSSRDNNWQPGNDWGK